MNSPSAIIVVGVGRSGTSLLQSMLAAHSKFAFPPETGFLRRYGATARLTEYAKGRSDSEIVAMLDRDDRLRRLPVSCTDLLKWARTTGELTDISFYQAILAASVDRQGGEIPGDKDPRLIEHLVLLKLAFPGAFVIQIIRDPRDVLVSKKKADWSRKRHIIRHVLAHRVQFTMGRRDGRRLFASAYHEIVYETLLADPENVLRELCVKLGAQYEQGMMEYPRAAEALVSPEEMSWKKETIGPLLRENRGKWRRELSAVEIALVELACGDALSAASCESSGAWNGLSLRDRARVVAMLSTVVLVAPAYLLFRKVCNWKARRRF